MHAVQCCCYMLDDIYDLVVVFEEELLPFTMTDEVVWYSIMQNFRRPVRFVVLVTRILVSTVAPSSSLLFDDTSIW